HRTTRPAPVAETHPVVAGKPADLRLGRTFRHTLASGRYAMSSQPTPSQPSAGVDLPLHRHEWDRLVRLPRHLLVVASAGDDTVDAVAGVEAIAAGQRSRALLVRGVVAAIFAEQVTDTAPLDRPGVLAECGAAA